MSSHHIVREKQEPALLILGLDTFDHELLGQLLEWSPTVIATSQVAEQLNMMGIKVDRVLGNDVGEVMQSNVTYISIHNNPAAGAALGFLTDEQYGAVNIITDEFVPEEYIPFVLAINLVVLHQHKKSYAISSGFTKWLPAGEVITFHSMPNELKSSGLSAMADGTYVTTADGVIKVEFADQFVFISETV
ncbi:thiamine pyrophosphokinase [Mucilaginibacter calamicampi]|uniref:Thiamine pyrophosphokinase n=1 Tax=Mucilaginibacter calamicampi TaxID=1302352 RepID=A0ABW2Z6D2_9SPHI